MLVLTPDLLKFRRNPGKIRKERRNLKPTAFPNTPKRRKPTAFGEVPSRSSVTRFSLNASTALGRDASGTP
jgi:hypothetical protein